MTERRRLFSLILIMTCVALCVGGIAGWVLYEAAIDETRERLEETAQSQARLIEAVARFDAVYSKDHPDGPEVATLSQIIDAHEHYKGFGETGEFTLAKREGDNIVFLLSHRHYDLENPKPVPINSELAVPMQQALSGEPKTLIGLDYRGEVVLAACEPVGVLNLGIVAKIDMAEVRAPFVRAASFAGGTALLLVALGSALFLRISNPMIALLSKQKAAIEAILETAAEAIVTIDAAGVIESFNPAAENMFGYAAGEAIGQNVSILMPPPYRDEHDEYITDYLKTQKPKILGVGREVLGCRKDGATFPVELTVSRIDHLQLFTGIMRDISQRKSLQRQLLTIGAEEQRRIGQDLHDGIGQELMALGMTTNTLLEALTEQIAAPPGTADVEATSEAIELASKVAAGLRQTLTQVRALSKGLIPVEVDAEGLMSALADLTAQISKLHGISCAFHCADPVPVEDNQTATHLYRIAQEAVTNAIKHAQTHDIRVSLETGAKTVTLTIEDDGIGIDHEDQRKDGIGLRIMQYRSDLIGGKLTIQRLAKGGTLVTCIVSNGTQKNG